MFANKLFQDKQKMFQMEQKIYANKFITNPTKNVIKGTKMFSNKNRVQSDMIIA